MARFMQLHLADHRSWEDWLFVILGALIILSPAIAINEAGVPALISGLAAGVVILAMTLFEAMNRMRLQEIVQFLAGVWLMASGYVIDYGLADRLRMVQFVLGAVVAILAAFEFWQDSVKKGQADSDDWSWRPGHPAARYWRLSEGEGLDGVPPSTYKLAP